MPEHVSAERLMARLHWLEKLRLLGAGGLVLLTVLVHFVLRLTLAWAPLLILAAVVVLYDLLFGMIRRRLQARPPRAVGFARLERFANFKIALDLIALTAALHFSGGVENPFAILYLLHPIIAAILLTRRSAYLHAGLSTLLLLGLGIAEAGWPSLHHPVGRYLAVPLFRNPLVIAAEVAALGISAHVSVYLVSAIAARLHQSERELREARDALEVRSRELAVAYEDLRVIEGRKSRFLSVAAHQLRGPLAATEGCLAAACDGYAADREKQAELFHRARVRIQSMLQIVNDLLTLANTHDPVESSQAREIRLDEVAAGVVDQHADFAASRQIDLVFYPGAHGARVVADERALGEAISNLVSNAIKYTPEGGHVKVATRCDSAKAVCEVIDDGIGIPEDEKDQLFREFFRASNARRQGQEGTGLGLTIVKEVVNKYGGQVKIESLENVGTCVVLSLPICEAAAAHMPRDGGC